MSIKLPQTILFLALATVICAIPVFGQTRSGTANETRPPNPNEAVSAEKSSPNNKSDFDGPPLMEMHVRQIIKAAEKEHLENMDRAREAAKISAHLKDTFVSAKEFALPDRKKLERVEKLTKRVRSEAGGSDSEMPLEEFPKDLGAALARMADLSEQMRKEVEKTPRKVVSAAVIENANRLLEVIQYTRRFSQ